ncbi:MAG: hypothetical protein WCL39_08755, partial [Armatimonadota bacterium]
MLELTRYTASPASIGGNPPWPSDNSERVSVFGASEIRTEAAYPETMGFRCPLPITPHADKLYSEVAIRSPRSRSRPIMQDSQQPSSQAELRPIKRQARLTTGGVYIILVVAVLLAAGIWETVRMYTRSPVAPVVENVTDDLNMKTIECVDYKIPPEKLWFGLPAPVPMTHIRETAPYLAWRERYQNALPLIEKDGHAAQASKLREWFYEYNASQIRSIKNGSKPPAVSPLFSQPEIQRFVRKPPQPAFEKFFGCKIILPWEKSVYYYAPNNLKPQTKYPLSKEGIFYAGTPVRAQKDIAQVFRLAGVVDPLAQNVLIKVSGQEGGFDAVNTWDTGCFSVGFIQF